MGDSAYKPVTKLYNKTGTSTRTSCRIKKPSEKLIEKIDQEEISANNAKVKRARKIKEPKMIKERKTIAKEKKTPKKSALKKISSRQPSVPNHWDLNQEQVDDLKDIYDLEWATRGIIFPLINVNVNVVNQIHENTELRLTNGSTKIEAFTTSNWFPEEIVGIVGDIPVDVKISRYRSKLVNYDIRQFANGYYRIECLVLCDDL